MIPFMPQKQTDPVQSIEAMIARIETAEADIRAGKQIDAHLLDAESAALAKLLKTNIKDRARLEAPLRQAVRAIESLTQALEDNIQTLKNT